MPKVFHPYHRTAWSARTSGMTLHAYNGAGDIVWEGASRKQACYLEIPEDAVIIAHFYYSNSGRSYIHFYRPQDGLPRAAGADPSAAPQEVINLLAELGVPHPSDASRQVLSWLYGEVPE